ncbi:MAG: serine/threonine protein kinase [Labilithrix sp.]|nr:serine/threonine protein kinase [Labilithrix sp.]MCW5816051.1 serine/threonine protein kinase [Labilithrix sp.]
MIASVGSRSSSRVPVLAKYDVLEELGHGGMATVYRARDTRLGRDVAIKVLHPHLRESTEIAHRFGVEAKAVAKLRHPNIVEVYDVSSADEGEQFLVVELVRGPTLRKLLQKHAALPPEIGAAIVMELLSGVAHAHAQGVIHRDVKPENVLVEHRLSGAPPSGEVTEKGDRVAVKLTDFGIAKLLDAQGVTSTGQVLGSPAHMAPEQIEGGDVDGRADVFGLGVLFYECVVGHLPFLGNNPAQVLRRVLDGVYGAAERERPVVGKRWSEILDRALARRPEDRYADAAAMRDAISVELGRLGMGAPRVEIEAWLDDPEGWTAAHDARLIERLCKLGAAERKRSDAVGAAADYNRALAYAPNDPQLLKVVASIQRSEERARLVRKVAPLVLGAAVLVPSAYFVVKAVKSEPVAGDPTKPIASNSVAAPRARTSVAERPTAARSATVTPPVTPTNVATRTVAAPSVFVPPKPVTRTVTFTTLRPAFGVRLAIDGKMLPDEVVPNGTVTVDEKAHSLAFSCRDDACTPRTLNVPAGENNVDLPIELAIPAAKLVVEGDPTHMFAIKEYPQLGTFPAGQEISVELLGGRAAHDVLVFDRNSNTTTNVTLKSGKKQTASFKK